MGTNAHSVWVCQACAHRNPRWFAKCPACASWQECVEELAERPDVAPSAPRESSALTRRGRELDLASGPRLVDDAEPPAPARRKRSKPIAITEVPAEAYERIQCGIEPVDRVLGGGFVGASLVLIGADPGCGKSTLLAQVLMGLVATGQAIQALYATGEESIGQAALRAHRIDAVHERIKIVSATNIDDIIEDARELRAQCPLVLVVDSIQCVSTDELRSIPGSVAQVKECTARLMRLAKQDDVIVLLIGHVTKDGALAGPQTLAHLVDVILHLSAGAKEEGLAAYRFLGAPSKNRFGSTMESGTLEMTDRGLIACDAAPIAEIRRERDEGFEPLAQELLNRYIAEGGHVDAELAARIGGRLDPTAWSHGAPTRDPRDVIADRIFRITPGIEQTFVDNAAPVTTCKACGTSYHTGANCPTCNAPNRPAQTSGAPPALEPPLEILGDDDWTAELVAEKNRIDEIVEAAIAEVAPPVASTTPLDIGSSAGEGSTP